MGLVFNMDHPHTIHNISILRYPVYKKVSLAHTHIHMYTFMFNRLPSIGFSKLEK